MDGSFLNSEAILSHVRHNILRMIGVYNSHFRLENPHSVNHDDTRQNKSQLIHQESFVWVTLFIWVLVKTKTSLISESV